MLDNLRRACLKWLWECSESAKREMIRLWNARRKGEPR